MKLEVIKTYILTILVLVSVLLTFAIWNYQPNYDFLYNNETEYVNEVDLGGADDKVKRDVIVPTSIIFHNDSNYFGFMNPRDQHLFYEDMAEWEFEDPEIEVAESEPGHMYQVELTFTRHLPAEIIRSLFVIDEDDQLPEWSFQRLFISIDNTEEAMQAHFISEDNDEQLTFSINGSNAFADVWAMFQGDERLERYIAFENSKHPIYLPTEKLDMRSQTFAIKNIDSYLLVNALFSNKDDVEPNFGEQYYTDGQRGMRILEGGDLVEFINPIHLKVHHTDQLELLESSIEHINNHSGWTDDYRFANINEIDDSIKYRMHYNDFPVFSSQDLSVIEQSWRDQDLHLYRRPLFSLDNLFTMDTITLASGEDIIYYLESNGNYSLDKIEKIQVGYSLSYSGNSRENVTFKPAWFMKYNGNWSEIHFDDIYEKGGS